MQIRPARPEDVPAVMPMVRKLYALHEKWDSAKYGVKSNLEERYSRWLVTRADDPRSVFLVAVVDDRPVAYLIGTVEQEIPIYRVAEYGFVHDTWVDEDYRHEGIGRQMTMTAVEKFASIGVTQIRLDTAVANDAARAMFVSCGFRPSITEMLIELDTKK